MSKVAFSYTSKTVNLYIDGTPYTLDRSTVAGTAVMAEIRKQMESGVSDAAALLAAADIRKILETYADGRVGYFSNNTVELDGFAMPDHLGRKILEFAKQGVDFSFLENFITRCKANPDHKTGIEEGLFRFLQHSHMPITPEGYIIGYKGVRADWTDRHSGLHSNAPGTELAMPRSEVVNDPDIGCGPGLHVGSIEYATKWATSAGRVVLVLVDPADVVSVPTDHDFQKLRACRYKVICEMRGPLPCTAVASSEDPYLGEEDWDDEDDDQDLEEENWDNLNPDNNPEINLSF